MTICGTQSGILKSFVACVLAALMICSVRAPAAEPAKRVVPWDMKALSRPPKIHETNERPAKGMR